MRTTAHLAHQALLLHLAAELTQRLLELLLILDDYLQTFTFFAYADVPPLATARISLRTRRCQRRAAPRTSVHQAVMWALVG